MRKHKNQHLLSDNDAESTARGSRAISKPGYKFFTSDAKTEQIALNEYFAEFEENKKEWLNLYKTIAKNFSYSIIGCVILTFYQKNITKEYRLPYGIEWTELFTFTIPNIIYKASPHLRNKIDKISLDLLLEYYYISCKLIHENNYNMYQNTQ